MKTLTLFFLLMVGGCAARQHVETASTEADLIECMDTDDLSAAEIAEFQKTNGCAEILAKAGF